MTELLNSVAGLLEEALWLAPVLAFVGGVFTSLTPCCLSSIPLVVGYVSAAGDSNRRSSLNISLVFAVGSALTFTLLGVAASTLGTLINLGGKWFYLVLGTLMILMALQTLDVINVIPSTYLTSKNSKRGYLGAFLAGVLGGLFSSPCATPVLVVLLGIASGTGSILWGGFLLLCYSIGHSIFIVVAGTSTGFVKSLSSSKKYQNAQTIATYVLAGAMIAMALFLFYQGF